MSYTPGPWKYEDCGYDYVRIWGLDGKRHMGYLNKQHLENDPVWDDARLIAAAPSCWRRAR